MQISSIFTHCLLGDSFSDHWHSLAIHQASAETFAAEFAENEPAWASPPGIVPNDPQTASRRSTGEVAGPCA
jgi:hypothetical protein